MRPTALLLGFALATFACAQDSATTPAPQEPPPVQQPTPPPPTPTPPITVEVDGRVVQFPNAKPKAFTGRILVPLRGVFQELGAYVEYNEVTRYIKARMGNEEIELRLGDRLARKNGAEIMMDIAPLVDQGSAMVPLRFLAEALGATVVYYKALNKVVITTADREEEPPFAWHPA